MTENANDEGEMPESPPSSGQKEPFRYGIGACIMPVHAGWKVEFFSVQDFEQELGTTYPSIEEAVRVVVDLLPEVNTEEQRAKAQQGEEMLRALLDEHPRTQGG